MGWVNVVLSAYDFLKSFISGSQGSGDALSRNAAIRGFQAAQQITNDLADAVWWGVARITEGAWESAAVHESTQRSLGSAQSATNLAVKHIVQVTLPRSFGYLEGKIVSRHIGPLGSKIADLNGRVGKRTSKNASTLNGWRNDIGDPLKKHFDALFGDWLKLAGWLGGTDNLPGLFGWNGKTAVANAAYYLSNFDRVAGAVINPLMVRRDGSASWMVSWLADPNHQGGLDDLLQVLIDNSGDRYRHVIQAGENILNSEYP